MTETVSVPRPHVPYGPHGVPGELATADYLDHAARNLAGGYEVGGYNVTATVIKLLHDTATALREAYEPLIECPHWEPGSVTLRKGCTACASDHANGGQDA